MMIREFISIRRPRSTLAIVGWTCLQIAALSGCSGPVKPQSSSMGLDDGLTIGEIVADSATNARARGRSVFPLQVGNRWTYSSETIFTPVWWVPEIDVPPQPYRTAARFETKLTCARDVAGRQLYVQELNGRVIEAPWGPGQEFSSWSYYREDSEGLYGGGFNGPQSDPCASADALIPATNKTVEIRGGAPFGLSANPGALGQSEGLMALMPSVGTQLLAYPLHVGARWAWDEAGSFGQEVEAIEVVDTPMGRMPAYRIRLFGVFPPGWSDTRWYGRVGLIKQVHRRMSECIDPPCGARYAIESTLMLTHVDLVRSKH